MESVVFDGKEYVKASVLAARFPYTADYLGQLCRGKKVDARLVGRAWYINLDSLNLHRSSRYKVAAPKNELHPMPKKPSSHYLSRIDVEPILKKKTVSLVKATRGNLEEFPVKYVGDDYSLIPYANKQAISVTIKVDQADAERVKIQKEKSPVTAFRAEELPQVYLKGRINVAGLEEATETEPELGDVKELEIKPERMPKTVTSGHQVTIRQIQRPTIAQTPSVPQTVVANKIQMKSSEVVAAPASQPIVLEQKPLVRPRLLIKIPTQVANTTPESKKRTSNTKSIAVVRVDEIKPSFKPQAVVQGEVKRNQEKQLSFGWFTVFVTLTLSLGLAVWMLGTRTEISTTSSTTSEHWIFDFAQLESMF